MRPPTTRQIALISLLLAAALSSGCSSVTPWLKPYERARLADPVMNPAANPASDNYMHHVHQAREGMRGAEGSAGGGCGCN